MSEELILYDLPSRAPLRSWSGNVWKTRLALNYKGIPYRTEWVPYTRLRETIIATGVKPNPPGSWSEYSVPTVQFSDGTFIMDSASIAIKLETLHPHPSLHFNPELENEAQAAMNGVFIALATYAIPLGMKNLIAEEDVEWFKADRASRFGMTVEQLEKGKDADTAFAAARPGFEKCREVLMRHKKDHGPFILGSQVSYADFYLVSTMQMFSQMGREFFERFLREAGPEMKRVFEACGRWTEKQT